MTTFYLHNRFLNTLHPFPFHSRKEAESFRDYLKCDDEIVTREVKVLSEDETEELELNREVERQIELDEIKYGVPYDEYR